MYTLTIRKIDDDLKQRLVARAAINQRSMAAELRSILREALVTVKPKSLADIALRIFGPENGFDMPEIPRSEAKGAVFDDN